jgi:organic radical activating enzyme
MNIKQIFQNIKDLFTQKEPLPAGFFTYQTPQSAEKQYRLHLRIEKDGTGLLVINASTVLHLNLTATEFAYHIIEESDLETVTKEISRRYRIDPRQAQQDYLAFIDKIETLIETPDLDPVTFLDIEREEPYSSKISAPYRLDCALTYNLSKGSPLESAPQHRVDRELTTDEWLSVIHKAYDHGIPHLIFTGGEPTTREDLPTLLQEAENLGLVTGLLTDGLKLADENYRNLLLMNGLDHLMIILDPENQQQWLVLEKILPEDVFTTVHLTLHEGDNLKNTIIKLSEMGANALSLSTINDRSSGKMKLSPEMQELRDTAAMHQLELVWDLPVPYSRNNPVTLELEQNILQDAPDGAGVAWLYIEPDGDVFPAQGMADQNLGNIIEDTWEDIWNRT